MPNSASNPGCVFAIVGRPNVGKSTLFNRLLGYRKAVVAPARGTTRDRLFGRLEWRRTPLTLIDTGGVEFGVRGTMPEAVQQQVGRAVQEADAFLFVCDAQDGLVPADQMILERLRTTGKPIILTVNKSEDRLTVPPEFLALGLPDPLPVSALHGRGTGDLLDQLVAHTSSAAARGETSSAAVGAVGTPVAVAIIGRQNVGKSSLLNALLREERVIVSEIPGTTRDAVDTPVTVQGTPLTLIDTAGLRHRRKVRDPVDLFAMARSLQAIDRCDVALLVLDATQGVTRDDLRILTQVCRKGCGLVMLANKWDLVAKRVRPEALSRAVHRAAPLASFAPVLAVSAKTGFQVTQSVRAVLDVVRILCEGLSEMACARLIQAAWRRQPPPRWRGRAIRLLQGRWCPGRPATIELVVAPEGRLPTPYQHYLLNAVHASPKLVGVPVRLRITKPDRRA